MGTEDFLLPHCSREIRVSVWVLQKAELKTQPVYMRTVLRNVMPMRRCEEEKTQKWRKEFM